MKKVLLLLAIVMMSLAANAQTRYYLVGNFNGWNTTANELVAQGDGTYVANVANLTSGFKVFENGDWRPVWYPNANATEISLNQPLTLNRDEVNDGPNIVFPETLQKVTNAVVTFTPSGSTGTIVISGKSDLPDLYITGSVTGWGYAGSPSDEGKWILMDHTPQGIYTATINVVNNPSDPTRFQINKQSAWNTYGLPANADKVTAPSSNIQLVTGISDIDNIYLDVVDGQYLVTFDYNTLMMSLESTGEAPQPTFPDLYITGSFVNWPQPGTNGSIKMTADNNGVYTGIVNVLNTTKEPTRFQIGVGGSWSCYGLPSDGEAITGTSQDVTLVAPGTEGAKDIYINAKGGGYVMTFDLPNMKLSVSPYDSGIADDLYVMFTGNSICDYWDDNEYMFFVENRLGNTGIAGETSRQILARFEGQAIYDKPAIVVIISPSTNDIAGNEGPVTHETMVDNVRQMVNLAKENGSKVILTSNLPCNYFFWRPEMRPGAEIRTVNGLLESLAAETGSEYVDLHTPLTDAEGALPGSFSEDGCHPNLNGYAVMKEHLMPVVQRLRNETSNIAPTIAVDNENAPIVYYNLQGAKIANPAAGNLYIMVQGNKAGKIIL